MFWQYLHSCLLYEKNISPAVLCLRLVSLQKRAFRRVPSIFRWNRASLTNTRVSIPLLQMAAYRGDRAPAYAATNSPRWQPDMAHRGRPEMIGWCYVSFCFIFLSISFAHFVASSPDSRRRADTDHRGGAHISATGLSHDVVNATAVIQCLLFTNAPHPRWARSPGRRSF